ncbi:MAG: c-type cytochrome domain-containing protein [Fidelibacterota bacterium]
MNRIIHASHGLLLGLVFIAGCSDFGQIPVQNPGILVPETIHATFATETETARIAIPVANNGGKDLMLWNWVLEPDSAFLNLSLDPSDTLILAPDERDTIFIEINPLSAALDSLALFFSSNDPQSPTGRVSIAITLTLSPVSYAAEVQPIFNLNCVGCHGNSGGLSLASYADLMAGNSLHGPVVTPGDGANSVIIQKLKGTADFGQKMPLGSTIPTADIATLETWINEGALDN